jgi:dienelactone hydrolase
VVLLPDPPDSLAAWSVLAGRLRERGYEILVPQLVIRRGAAPLAAWGKPEDPDAPWASAWEQVLAVVAAAGPAGAGRVVLGGTGRAAALAAMAASHLPGPPAALLLVGPVRELAGVPLGPVLAGLAVPALVLAPTDDRETSESAREIHLAARPSCRLWVIDGYACTPRTIGARPMLAVDLADWIARQ